MAKLTPLEFVNELRKEEIAQVITRYTELFAGKDALEIGSGAGAQLLEFRKVCRSAVGIDVSLRPDRLTDIVQYDGKHVPFPDSSFDLIFSSHVLEHIRHQEIIHAEMHRLLRSGGRCVHIVPTASWRIWASLLHYPALMKKLADKLSRNESGSTTHVAASTSETSTSRRWRERLSYALFQPPHGELGNWFSEHFLFRVSAWRKRFETYGWNIEVAESFGVVVSGHYLLNERLSLQNRRRLASVIGPSSFLFVLRSLSN